MSSNSVTGAIPNNLDTNYSSGNEVESPPRENHFSSGETGRPINTDQAVQQVVSRWRGGDLVKGLFQSKFARAAVFSGVIVTIFCATMIHAFGIIPPPWMVTAVGVGSYLLGMGLQLPLFNGLQRLRFEIATVRRAFMKNYDKIIEVPGRGSLYLGALPNRLRSEGETLVNEEQIGYVLSLNEPWERLPYGLSLPYTCDDWEGLKVNGKSVEYATMNVEDHTLLDVDQLDQAADLIHDAIQSGLNVYVHCRAGVGRSGMAIAAYLIKYHEKTVDAAADLIKTKRPCATIMKKLERLDEYREVLFGNTTSKVYSQDEIKTLLKNEQFVIAQDQNGKKAIIAKDEKGEVRILRKDHKECLSLLLKNKYTPYRSKRVILFTTQV